MSTYNIDALVSAIANYPICSWIDTSVAIPEIDDLFQRLEDFDSTSLADSSKSAFVKEVAPFAHTVYSHVLLLSQHFNQRQQQPSQNYDYESLFNSATETQQALAKILRLSFNEDYRAAEISLDLVNAICQLLVMNVVVFGLKKEKLTQETRRIIGNTLTNLTFGNIKVKLKICSHDGFLDTVVRLIDSHDELLQAYAALIRNLSWNADIRMTKALAKTVPALSRAATIRLHDLHSDKFMRKDVHDNNKSLLAVLSALWNLASHSIDNKRSICETQAFLYLLVVNIKNDPDKTSFLENASGILKYVSGYIAEKELLLKIVHEAKIVKALFSLLSSSSFTVVLNALGSLGALVAKDQRTQLKLVQSEHARLILESLKHSARDDVRNEVKMVLSHLNSSPLTGFAMTLPSASRMSSRSKELKNSYDANAVSHFMSNQQLLPYRQVSQSIVSPDTPTSFNATDGLCFPVNAYSTFPYSSRQNQIRFVPSAVKPNDFVFHNDLTESQIGTCSGSTQSLTNDVATNWQSNITTTRNSGDQSPISLSNFPESPSNLFLNDDDREVNQHQIEEESCILAEAIEAVMPKPRQVKSPNYLIRSDSIDDGTAILTDAIESVMPKPRRRTQSKPNQHTRSVEYWEPKSTAKLDDSRRTHIPVLEQSALLINEATTEKVRDASKLERSKSVFADNHSEDNFCVADVNYVVDGMVPQDVDAELQAEQMVIDCLSVGEQKQRAAAAKPSQTDRQIDASEAQLKRTNRSARVSPFNYKKPVQRPSNLNEKSEKSVKSAPTKASITVANL